MEIEYIIIFQNCGKSQTKHAMRMFNNIEYWDESKLKRDGINPKNISEILVGPKTVLEIFSDKEFNGDYHKIINDKENEGITYKVGCPDDPKWKPSIGSLIIWTYENYDKTHGVPYCQTDRDCKWNEMCLCRKGQSHPSWCPKEKRRCMNRMYFTYEFPITLNENDQIDLDCYQKELTKMGPVSDSSISEALDRDLQRRCAKEKIQELEHFDVMNNNSYLMFFILLLLCVFLIFSR